MHFSGSKYMKKTHLSPLIGTEGNTTPAGNPQPGLWTARHAANCAGFQSPVTILRAFRRGELPGYKLNARTIRFDPADVKAWITAARVSGKRGAK